MFRPLLLGLLLATTEAHADERLFSGIFFSIGNVLYDHCEKLSQYCVGYVLGIADAMKNHNTVDGYASCIPDQSTGTQLIDVVIKYMSNHPERRHEAAVSLVSKAFEEAFPCGK